MIDLILSVSPSTTVLTLPAAPVAINLTTSFITTADFSDEFSIDFSGGSASSAPPLASSETTLASSTSVLASSS